MDDPDLTGRSILVAEDEHVVANSLVHLLEIWGATIVGPASTLRSAIALATGPSRIDAAIIDVNLNGELAFPVADALAARGALLIFTTGYDAAAIPASYRHIAFLQKPYQLRALAQALQPLGTGGRTERQ